MRIFRSILGYAFAAMALCFSGFGFADSYHERFDFVTSLTYFSGDYGAESAKFKAELTHMASIKADRTSSLSGLTRESNGFRLTAMTAIESGVAGGKTGVGTGHQV